jgi:hypothetical protein
MSKLKPLQFYLPVLFANFEMFILETFHVFNPKATFACVAEKCKFIRNSAEQTVWAEPLMEGRLAGGKIENPKNSFEYR